MTTDYDRFDPEEDIQLNRRLGHDDGREGDGWNQCRHPVKTMHGSVGTYRCTDCGQVMSFLDAVGSPETPVQPRMVPWWTLIPQEDRDEVIKAYRHFLMVRHYPKHHDATCFCGQPVSDDEQPIDVPLWGFNEIMVPHDWKVE